MNKYVILCTYQLKPGNSAKSFPADNEAEQSKKISSLIDSLQDEDELERNISSLVDSLIVAGGSSPNVPNVLHSNNTYVAILPHSEKVLPKKMNKDGMWHIVNDAVKEKVKKSIELIQSINEGRTAEESISRDLHLLLDHLPNTGSCLIDFYWITSQPGTPMDIPLFSGVVQRLTKWHLAHLYIWNPYRDVVCSNSIQSWRDEFGLEGLDLSVQNDVGSCWRGWLGMRDHPKENWMHLPCQLSACPLDKLYATNVLKNEKGRKSSVNISPLLEVLEECDIESVPPFYFSGKRMFLSFAKCQDHHALKWLFQYWGKNKKMSVLMRLSYDDCDPPKNEFLTTKRWNEWIMKGEFYDGPFQNTTHTQFNKILMLFVPDRIHYTKGLVHILKNSTEIPSNITSTLMRTITSNIPAVSNGSSLFQQLHPTLDTYRLLQLINIVEETQVQIIQQWIEQNKSITEEEFQGLLEEIEKEVLQNVNLKDLQCDDQNSVRCETVSEKEGEAERRALKYFNHSAKMEDNKLICKPQTKPVHVTMLPVDKMLERIYRPNNTLTKITLPRSRRNPYLVNMCNTSNDAVNTPWPQVLNVRYHDVYYSEPGDCEEFHKKCAAIQDRCHGETGSTCISFPTGPVIVIPKTPTPKKTVIPNALRRSPRKHGQSLAQKKTVPTIRMSVKSVNKTNRSHLNKIRLQNAVTTALENNKIPRTDSLFPVCYKKLLTICETFFSDLDTSSAEGNEGKTGITKKIFKVACAHVKQVIKFQKEQQRK